MDKSISEKLEGVSTLDNVKSRLQKDLKLETPNNRPKYNEQSQPMGRRSGTGKKPNEDSSVAG